MRIISANKYYFVNGGSDRYFFDLNALHRAAGHAVIPYAMAHPRNEPSEFASYFASPVNFWDNPSFRERMMAAGRVLYSTEVRKSVRRLVRAERPNMAHIHLVYHHLSPSFLPVLRDEGIPIVQTLHDYKPVCPSYSLVAKGRICERCKGGRFYQAVLQRCNHGSILASAVNVAEMYLHHRLGWYDIPDLYIAPSAFMRNKLIEFGMAQERIVHVPNFVDTSAWSVGTAMDRYVVYAGRLVDIKGVHTLLKAFALVGKTDVRLVIIGDGPQRRDLEAFVTKAELPVEFRGHQPREAVAAAIAGSMFTVLPSEVYENCPLAVLEAMATGKAVIGARIGGIPELIVEGETGLLFESGNADELAEHMQGLASDPARCRQMGRAGRERVERLYGPQEHYERILDVYDRARTGALAADRPPAEDDAWANV